MGGVERGSETREGNEGREAEPEGLSETKNGRDGVTSS